VKSASEVAKHLDLAKYEPFYVKIATSGAWTLADGRPAVLSPDRREPGLLALERGRYEAIGLDVVLPILHGKLGEDGAIQGLLELSGIPYVGCDIQSSALCMDKSLTYMTVRAAGIATPTFWDQDVDPDALTYPVFVKPARSGSSFGVSKVASAQELQSAIDTAKAYDSKVLIEAAVSGTEIGCAILGNGAELLAGEVDQIALSHGFFRIHQEDAPEQGSDNATVTVPADIPAEARSRIQDTAKAIYRALGCRGLARVDMFLTEDGTVVLNEVNTFPGLTSYSRYPRMMAAAGLPMSAVLDRMIELALA
jgi:D-alanine--(R)-lactate ligase